MQRLEVSGAVRPIYGSLGVKSLRKCAASRKVAGSIPDDIILSAALWSWG